MDFPLSNSVTKAVPGLVFSYRQTLSGSLNIMTVLGQQHLHWTFSHSSVIFILLSGILGFEDPLGKCSFQPRQPCPMAWTCDMQECLSCPPNPEVASLFAEYAVLETGIDEVVP